MGTTIPGPVFDTVVLQVPGDNPLLVTATGTIASPNNLGVDGTAGTAWTVTNQGRIGASGPKSTGVLLRSGGTIVNDLGGQIAGTYYGANIINGFGVVQNLGTIAGTDMAGGAGVLLNGGGTIVNGSVGVGTARIEGGTAAAAYIKAGAADRVTNFGTIAGLGDGTTGVALWSGGTVENRTGGMITAPHNGVGVLAAKGTVSNDGQIAGTGATGFSAYGVYLGAGGSVANGAANPAAGISGRQFGVAVRGGAGTVTNSGAITGQHGVLLAGGGTVVNEAGGSIRGELGIDGQEAVQIEGGGTLVNRGLIHSTGSNLHFYGNTNPLAVNMAGGGLVTVAATGTISASARVSSRGVQGATAVVNEGLIAATTALSMGDGNTTVTNSGTIAGSVQFNGTGVGRVVNSGVITGPIGLQPNALAGGTVSNSGTIAALNGSAQGDRLVVTPDAVFTGVLDGSFGSDVIELGAGGSGVLGGFGSSIIGFETVAIGAGASWTLRGAPAGLAAKITGFTADDTIDLLGYAGTIGGYAAGVLTLNGSTTATLNLPGSFSAGSFIATPDGSGGTLVRLREATTIELAASKIAIAEGNSGSTAFSVDVVRSGVLTAAQSVAWSVVGAGADAADFAGGVLPAGTVEFAAGETRRTISVSVAGDTAHELDEGFEIRLGAAPVGVTLGTAVTQATILDDDRTLLAVSAGKATVAEGSGGGLTSVGFTVTRGGDVAAATTVGWAAGGVAGSGFGAVSAGDFVGGVFPSGTVTFGPGETSRSIVLSLLADTAWEADEGVRVTLSAPTGGAELATASADVLVTNDDIAQNSVALSPGLLQVKEGSGGSTVMNFTAGRTGDVAAPLALTWDLVPSGATPVQVGDFFGGVPAGKQYPGGTVSFAPGEASAQISVNLSTDQAFEPDERFQIVLSGAPAGTTLAQGSATGVILNDDTGISVVGGTASQAEGNAGTVSYSFTLQRFAASALSMHEVSWWVSGIGANPATAADFAGGVLPGGSVVFSAGETTKTVTVGVRGDAEVEPDEGFRFEIGMPTNGAQLGTSALDRMILSDDSSVAIVPLAASRAEGTGGTTGYTFTVKRTGATAGAASVDYAVAGSAGAGTLPADAADFAGGGLPAGTISFAPGEVQKTLTVPVSGDAVGETNERFAVALSSPQGTVLGTSTAEGVILNDDVSFAVAATTPALAEGQDGSRAFSFVVTRGGLNNSTNAVTWMVAGSGTNKAGTDDFAGGVLPAGGTLTFAPGESAKPVTVLVRGDITVEPDETFDVVLSAPTGGAVVAVPNATATIVSDDSWLYVTPAMADRAEGTGGTTPFTFTITRDGLESGTATVRYAVVGGLSLGGGVTSQLLVPPVFPPTFPDSLPASADDFAGGVFPSGILTFAPGETAKVVTVDVNADDVPETREYFSVVLSQATGAFASAFPGIGYIQDDDAQLRVVANTQVLPEGETGSRSFTFTVSRDGNLLGFNEVSWSVAGSGTTPADASDFAGGALPTGKVSFGPWEISKAVTVLVRGDNVLEADETFDVVLHDATGGIAIAVPSDTAMILHDEGLVPVGLVSVSPLAAIEPEGAEPSLPSLHLTPLTFTVARSGDASGAAAVGYTVVGTALPGSQAADEYDLMSSWEQLGTLPSGVVGFFPGETEKKLTLQVLGDASVEPDESFSVILRDPVGVSIGEGTAYGTILADDNGFNIVAQGPSLPEGQTGGQAFSFVVQRLGDSSTPQSVGWLVGATGANPATAEDFVNHTWPTGGRITFAPGETEKTIEVQVQGDAIAESDETFRVEIQSPSSGAGLASIASVATILNDDSSISIAPLVVTRAEGSGGTTAFSFMVSRNPAAVGTATIGYSVAGAAGSGTLPANAADFAGGVLPAGMVSFAAGETQKTLVVNVAADLLGEANERFAVTLANPVGAALGKASAEGVILNDDTSFAVAATTPALAEGQGGSRAFGFVVQRAGIAGGTNAVDWSVQGTGASAADAADFAGGALPGGTLTFAPNEGSRTVTVLVAGDTALEPDEAFRVVLDNPTGGAVVAVPAATATILNDDAALSIVPLANNKLEGTGGTTTLTFTVNRVGASGAAATVGYAVSGVTGSGTMPTDAADFVGGVLPAGVVSFAAGETSKVLSVAVLGDLAGELNERFAVTLSNPVGAVLGTASAQGIIRNDDISVGFSAGNVARPEGNSGTTTFSFTVARNGTLTGATTVDWSFAAGGVAGTVAASAADFAGGVLPAGGTVSFAPGQSVRTVAVAVAGDTAPEGGLNESFTLTLGNATAGVAIVAPTASGTIRDDDTIYGTAGNDTLAGTAGGDLFVIGQGQDSIAGGGGVDQFRFIQGAVGAVATHRFALTDFAPAAGERIDLSRIDAIAGTLANDAFAFIGTLPLSGAAGQLRWERLDAGHVLIQGGVNADAVADLTIVVDSTAPVAGGWFVL